MGDSSFFVGIVGLVLVAALVLALRWAAIERGRVHREWSRLERGLAPNVFQSLDWCVAAATAAGCV
jgi:hypothetical protein